jgi:hypothetical protein
MDMVETVELLVAAHIMVERLLAWALGQIVELLLVAQNLPQLLLPFREGRTGTGLLLMLVLWLLLAYTSDWILNALDLDRFHGVTYLARIDVVVLLLDDVHLLPVNLLWEVGNTLQIGPFIHLVVVAGILGVLLRVVLPVSCIASAVSAKLRSTCAQAGGVSAVQVVDRLDLVLERIPAELILLVVGHQGSLAGGQHVRPVALMLLDLHLLVWAQAQVFDGPSELLLALGLLLTGLAWDHDLILALHEPALSLVCRILRHDHILVLILADGFSPGNPPALETTAEAWGIPRIHGAYLSTILGLVMASFRIDVSVGYTLNCPGYIVDELWLLRYPRLLILWLISPTYTLNPSVQLCFLNDLSALLLRVARSGRQGVLIYFLIALAWIEHIGEVVEARDRVLSEAWIWVCRSYTHQRVVERTSDRLVLVGQRLRMLLQGLWHVARIAEIGSLELGIHIVDVVVLLDALEIG